MKIISIKKEGPELWKIKYKTLFGIKERVIFQHRKIDGSGLPFKFRDDSDYVDAHSGRDQILWMIKNNISEYDESNSKLVTKTNQ